MALTTPLPEAAPAPIIAAGPPQYSLRQIAGVWAAAALPMGFLSWVAAPWVADRLDTADPLPKALIACLTLGLVWQFVLVVILIARRASATRCGCAGRSARAPGGAAAASGSC